MEKEKLETITIGRRLYSRWTNLGVAAKRLGRCRTQIQRHINGEVPSKKLAADMARLGVVVETVGTAGQSQA